MILPARRQIFLLADGKVNLDRIHLRNSRKHSGRAHKIADLGGSDAGDAIDERTNFGESDIQLRRCDTRLGCLDTGLTRFDESFILALRLNVVIELALRDGMRSASGVSRLTLMLCETELSLRLPELPVCLCELSLGLFERGLKGRGVNLEQHVALCTKEPSR